MTDKITILVTPSTVAQGDRVELALGQELPPPEGSRRSHHRWEVVNAEGVIDDPQAERPTLDTSGLPPGDHVVRLHVYQLSNPPSPTSNPAYTGEAQLRVESRQPAVAGGGGGDRGIRDARDGDGDRRPTEHFVSLRRTEVEDTADRLLWEVIKDRTTAMSWDGYNDFMNKVLCGREGNDKEQRIRDEWQRGAYVERLDAYRILRLATDLFLRQECGVVPTSDSITSLDPVTIQRLKDDYLERVNGDDARTLPYLARIRGSLADVSLRRFPAADYCYGIIESRILTPCLIELIWSYWMEEGMLVQTLNAIAFRFQNRARPAGKDPLENFELDPLRPANNLLWGYIQDEHNRLSIARRAYEYLHHYGFSLMGKAVPMLRPADSRSKFLEAFHNLLYATSRFYRDDDDMTISADAFPILNALKDVHLILAYGAHNQYGDLPWTARVEMMTQQWILSRPEIRSFLGGRTMVPYREAWMGNVDAMKTLQGWTDVSITHFRDLAVYGEQIVLSVRFGNWSQVADAASAANWARIWRSEIQGYTHAYRAATGVDLTLTQTANERRPEEVYEHPSTHLQRRLAAQPRVG